MGGSLRRSKKYRPKLTIRKKRTALTRGKTPIEITQGKAAVAEKLGKQCVSPLPRSLAPYLMPPAGALKAAVSIL